MSSIASTPAPSRTGSAIQRYRPGHGRVRPMGEVVACGAFGTLDSTFWARGAPGKETTR